MRQPSDRSSLCVSPPPTATAFLSRSIHGVLRVAAMNGEFLRIWTNLLVWVAMPVMRPRILRMMRSKESIV